MKSSNEIKNEVKDAYGRIARTSSGCGSSGGGCCGSVGRVSVQTSVPYKGENAAAVPEGADLGLGCGIPVPFADIREGQTVLDLGSGAGIDVFVAARHVGPKGRVIGVDLTPDMIEKARANARSAGVTNVEFRLGDIEHLPIDDGTIDRVLSNCVINLVPDKSKAFAEIFRVLNSGGRMTISDIVSDGPVSEKDQQDSGLWSCCLGGALPRDTYLALIRGAGFTDVTVDDEQRYDLRLENGTGFLSITVSATRP